MAVASLRMARGVGLAGQSLRPGLAFGRARRPGRWRKKLWPSYRADGQGGLQGGGYAWGKDWRNDQGWLIGYGNNFGKAWRPNGQGGYDGMAKDYGQGWRNSPGDKP